MNLLRAIPYGIFISFAYCSPAVSNESKDIPAKTDKYELPSIEEFRQYHLNALNKHDIKQYTTKDQKTIEITRRLLTSNFYKENMFIFIIRNRILTRIIRWNKYHLLFFSYSDIHWCKQSFSITLSRVNWRSRLIKETLESYLKLQQQHTYLNKPNFPRRCKAIVHTAVIVSYCHDLVLWIPYN